jgi:hypothetical protein
MRLRYVLGPIVLVVLGVVTAVLTARGVCGYLAFLALPSIVGAIVSIIFTPRTPTQAAGIGATSVLLALLLFLLLGQEGAGCLIMAAPLAIPLGALGGLLTYRARDPKVPAGMMLLLVPPSFIWDTHAHAPLYAVHTSIEVAAPPERVWPHVISFPDLAAPEEWYFRTGVAYPIRAHIDGTGPGAVRYCEFSTGPFVEPIDTWDAPRLLRFRVTKNPAPMRDWSPYHVQPKHLDGYLVSKKGQFQLTASQSPHASRRHHLVHARPVARPILAPVVGRDYSPHPSASFKSHPGAGGK